MTVVLECILIIFYIHVVFQPMHAAIPNTIATMIPYSYISPLLLLLSTVPVGHWRAHIEGRPGMLCHSDNQYITLQLAKAICHSDNQYITLQLAKAIKKQAKLLTIICCKTIAMHI